MQTQTPPPSSTNTYTIQQGDLWDNGFDNVHVPRQSAFSRFVFTTTASNVTVAGDTTIYGSYPQWAHLGVRVNGVDEPPLVFTGNGSESFAVNLGSPGAVKTVELSAGLQSNPAGTVIGTFLDSVTYDSSTPITIEPPVAGNGVLVYADSIGVGADSTNPETEGYTMLLRRLPYNLRLAEDGWGYRSLYDDANTPALLSSLVSHLASYQPGTVLVTLGGNDYGLDKWSAASFGAAYGKLLDGLHAALPAAQIVCLPPTIRVSPAASGPNTFGNSLSNYMAEVATNCSTRPWARLVDSTTIILTSDLDTDGVHPTTAGHARVAQRIYPYLVPPTPARVVPLLITITSAGMDGRGNRVFNLHSSRSNDVPSSFVIQQSVTFKGPYTDVPWAVVVGTAGHYTATVPQDGEHQFYRVRHL